MNTTPQAPSIKKTEKEFREELEALNKQGGALNEQRIRIQTEIERARKEKAELEAALESEFGTSDLSRLSSILTERESQNEAALARYREELAELRALIESIMPKLSQRK